MKTKKFIEKVVAPVLISGAILAGCSGETPQYQIENQTLQGWYRSGSEPDSPTVLVFDSLEVNQRRSREPQYRFIYDGSPEGEGLERFAKYDLVVSDSSYLGRILGIKKSR